MEKFQLLLDIPRHPSFDLIPLRDNIWRARVGDHYRALARKSGDVFESRQAGRVRVLPVFVKGKRGAGPPDMTQKADRSFVALARVVVLYSAPSGD